MAPIFSSTSLRCLTIESASDWYFERPHFINYPDFVNSPQRQKNCAENRSANPSAFSGLVTGELGFAQG
jgi:hypothetical protein